MARDWGLAWLQASVVTLDTPSATRGPALPVAPPQGGGALRHLAAGWGHASAAKEARRQLPARGAQRPKGQRWPRHRGDALGVRRRGRGGGPCGYGAASRRGP